VTALNDWATGIAFPLGMNFCRLYEATKDLQERQALTRTMGHILYMRTHEISLTKASKGKAAEVVTRCIKFGNDNPFWVASATRKIINGHNGIWLPPFLSWAEQLVADHLAVN
jgi:hypothetical protein